MSVIEKLGIRVAALERAMANVCRMGKVTAVDPVTGLVTVDFGEDLVINNIPFLTMKAGEDKTYWLPSVGELGLMFSPSGDVANAFFVPGIFYQDFPIPETNSELKAVTVYRDGLTEEVDTDAHSSKLTSGDSERFIDRDKIEDKKGTANKNTIDGDETKLERSGASITIDNSEIAVERTAGGIKLKVGTNEISLSAILANILGAQLFASGITTLQSPVGPVMFAPSPSPASAPAAPAGSSPNSDGEATKIPPQTKSGVGMTSGTIQLVIPAIAVTGAAGPNPVVAQTTPFTLNVNFSASGVTLSFPATDL